MAVRSSTKVEANTHLAGIDKSAAAAVDQQALIEGLNHNECVVAVFANPQQVERAMQVLNQGRFPIDQISVVAKSLHNHAEQTAEINMGGDDSVRDAALGAGVGGLGGGLAGLAMTAVFGVGMVFFVGPLGLAMAGAVAGAFLGAMGGWGVHEERIRHYEALVKAGNLLVIAHGNPLEVIEAERMLKDTDPAEIHIYAKTSSESPEVNPHEAVE